MADIMTKEGVRITLHHLTEEQIKAQGAGVAMVLQNPFGDAIGVQLTLQNMRDLLSSLAGTIQPAAELADSYGLDDQDGPVDPTASAS